MNWYLFDPTPSGKSLSEAWTRFKDLLQKVSHHGIDLWLQILIVYDRVNPIIRRTIDQAAGGKLHDKNNEESWALLEDLALYDNESWNDPRDLAKLVKAISKPHDIMSASDRRLIKLENQVQRMMEAHLSQSKPIQVNKIASSCKICSGPYDIKYCMEYPERAFVDYASTRTNEAGNKWYTFKPEENNLGDTYNPSWKSHTNLRLGDSKPFDTLADLGSCVNLLPLKIFKELKVGLLEETNNVLELADRAKSYPVGIVRNVEVHVGKLKLFEDFHVVDMEREPTCPLLVGRGILATANAVIDCKKAKIAVGERLTRLIFGVKELDFGDDNEPYWTTIGKRESYKPRTSKDGIGVQPPPPKEGDGVWHIRIELIDPDGEKFNRMTKLYKGEFKKIKDVKVEDVSLTCDAPLEVFINEVSRLSGMDDDLFTYKVEVANIPCDSKMDDDSEQEADDDMGYDPSDVAFTEWIDTNLFDFETPMCKAFKEFKYGQPVREDGYCNGENLPGAYHIGNSLHYQDLEWYEALEDCELKDEALRNKAIMEGFIKEDNDESRYEQRR
ncbi:MAK10-like protein [Tanacetum coccineum]